MWQELQRLENAEFYSEAIGINNGKLRKRKWK